MLSLSLNSQNNLNNAFNFNVREVMKFNDLGNQHFETDFRIVQDLNGTRKAFTQRSKIGHKHI